MPSRRRYLGAIAASGSAALAGCNSLPVVGDGSGTGRSGGGSVTLRDDYPSALQVADGWRSARRDDANTACARNAATLSKPGVEWRSPQVPIQSTLSARKLTVAGATVLTGGDFAVGYDVVSGDSVWEQDGAVPRRDPLPAAKGVAWSPAADSDSSVVGLDVATGDVARRIDLPVVPHRPPVPLFGEYGFSHVVPADPGLAWYDPENPDERSSQRVFGSVREPPAVTPTTVAATTTTGELYAFTRRGEPGWRVNFAEEARAAPIVGDSRVYASTGAGVVAFNQHDGSVAWRNTDLHGPPSRSFALGGKRLFVGVGEDIYALSTETGELAWQHSLSADANGLAVGGDNVYVAAGTSLHALSRDGSENWALELDGELGSTVAVTENRIYTFVTDADGRARILALA